jgi:hypothetical protein
LDEREREAKPLAFWADGSPADEAQLVTVSRVYFRVLIDVARTAERAALRGFADREAQIIVDVLVPLRAEAGEE